MRQSFQTSVENQISSLMLHFLFVFQFNFTAVFQLLTSTLVTLLSLLGIPQLLAALGLPINLTALLGL